MKTYSAKPKEIKREWYIVDASKYPLGRFSTRIATILVGKHKPMYTSHIDCGDYVVVINSDKLKVTGNKQLDKKYYRHSQYPGSLKESSLSEMVEKDSTKVIELAIKRMLPDNKLRDNRMARLKVYKDDNHANSAQQPKELEIKGDK